MNLLKTWGGNERKGRKDLLVRHVAKCSGIKQLTYQRKSTSTQSPPGSCGGFPQVLQHCSATQWQFHLHSL